MAIIKYPNNLETAVDAMSDTDLAGFYQPGTTAGVRKQKKNLLSVWKSFFNLAASQRGLITGRFDSQELPESGSLTAGTYTIAETEDTADFASGCQLRIVSALGVDLIEVDFKESASAKTHQNTKIELLNAVIGNFRLAKSDSINGAGAKIQIVLPSTTTLKVQLISNIGDGAGWQLVTPTSAGIGLLPDGVTAATFLDAGEELSFDDNTITPFQIKKLTDDILFATVYWPEIPKQGSSLVLTFPTNLVIRDGSGTSISLPSGTISNELFNKNTITFRINNVSAFAALNFGPLVVEVSGAGGKLTIT